MFTFKPKFDTNKTKVNLKMLTNRFQLLTQKKANLAKQQKRQVATLLRDDKEQNARILVEHIIREARSTRQPMPALIIADSLCLPLAVGCYTAAVAAVNIRPLAAAYPFRTTH